MEQLESKNLNNTQLGLKERGLGKCNADVRIKDYYTYYKNNLTKKELPLGTDLKDLSYNVTATTYRKVLMSIFLKAREKMILNNLEYILPCKMGKIAIFKHKKKLELDEDGNIITKLAVDYKATRQMWAEDPEMKAKKKIIFHLNNHTDEYTFKITWIKNNCNMFKKKFYKLVPVRDFKRQVPKLLKEKPNLDFFLFPNSDND
jgi:hypothetical protein